jgi:hypothetical protein
MIRRLRRLLLEVDQREGSRNRCRGATVLICPWQDPTTKRNLRNLRIIPSLRDRWIRVHSCAFAVGLLSASICVHLRLNSQQLNQSIIIVTWPKRVRFWKGLNRGSRLNIQYIILCCVEGLDVTPITTPRYVCNRRKHPSGGRDPRRPVVTCKLLTCPPFAEVLVYIRWRVGFDAVE